MLTTIRTHVTTQTVAAHGRAIRLGHAAGGGGVWPAVAALLILALALPARAAGPLVVISITAGSEQTICDTDDPGECITVTDGDLILCKPLSFGGSGEITGCDWSILFDGDDPAVPDDQELNQQLRALEIAPNGALAFVVGGSDTIPGLSTLKDNDITVFSPNDVLKPYVGGGPYTTPGGVFKKYLNGELTQQDATAKPWDAVELLSTNLLPQPSSCADNLSAGNDNPRTCTVVGSLTAGSGTGNNFGAIHFANEDLIRCIPTAWAGNGAVEGCDYSVMLDSSALNGGGSSGITSDIEAIDFLSFDHDTMSGQMVFQKKSGNPDGFPPHEPGRDLLLYTGSFGSGECVPSGNPCAGNADCPGGETCNTGSCSLTPATPCTTDQDCSGSGNVCNHTRGYTATVTLFFDGSAVGLAGAGQKIEAFSIAPDDDGDGIPSGVDNCPNTANPPSVCSGGTATCPSGLSSECPPGETCQQEDTDGDGVGDPCDQCSGRDDAVCFCGDGILDRPSEDCDLGALNGEPSSPCSLTCQISGTCTTTSSTSCTSAGDCPPGEGCCGDGVVDSPAEQCDDANAIGDDVCDNQCLNNPFGTPILGCEDVTGPHLVPAFVKIAKFRNGREFPDDPELDRWKTKGDFNFVPGITVDPDSEPVTITFNNNLSGLLFQKTLPAGNFVQQDPAKLKWKFFDKFASIVPGWRKGKFTQRENKVKFVLDGRNALLFTAAALDTPPTLRGTLRVGDVCATTVVTCEIKRDGKVVKCPP